MIFKLMNYDIELVEFELSGETFKEEPSLQNVRYIASIDLVQNLLRKDLSMWLRDRFPDFSRDYMFRMGEYCHISTPAEYLLKTYGLSLNDALWVKTSEDTAEWKDVNLYTNDFNTAIATLFSVKELPKDFAINDSRILSPEFSTRGFYRKFWSRDDGHTYLYKGDCLQIKGLEPFSEVLASQVVHAIELESFIDYDLVVLDGVYYSKCELFTSQTVGFKTHEQTFPYRHRNFDEVFSYMQSTPYFDKYCEMIVLDAITVNVDRDCKNWGGT